MVDRVDFEIAVNCQSLPNVICDSRGSFCAIPSFRSTQCKNSKKELENRFLLSPVVDCTCSLFGLIFSRDFGHCKKIAKFSTREKKKGCPKINTILSNKTINGPVFDYYS